jgi:hypothetical protein
MSRIAIVYVKKEVNYRFDNNMSISDDSAVRELQDFTARLMVGSLTD